MTARQSPFASFLILVLPAVLGTFLVLYATPQGLGLSDDSIAYIAGARSILNGDGYREAWLASNQPMTHFPPGFSSVLALVGLSGLDPLRGTRLVNSLLFGINTFLLGLIGWRMTKSRIAGLILAILFLLNSSIFRVHTTAMSEPLYIFFTLAAFLAFSQYIFAAAPTEENQNLGRRIGSNGFLITAAALTAFAYLTRYAGLALLATFFVSLFILHDTWKKRFTSIGIFIAGFVPFALAWSIRNKLLAETATNRAIVYHPVSAENIQLGLSNFAAFLMPVDEWRRVMIKAPNLMVVVLSAIALVLLVWAAEKGLRKLFQPSAETTEALSFLNTLYIFGYMASIVASMTWFDAATKFQLRILSPVYVSLLVMLVYFGVWFWNRQAAIWRIAAILFAVCMFSLSMYGMSGALAHLRKGGQGFASFQWFDSEAMEFLRGLPEGTRIYSNQVGPVYLYTDRSGYVLPDLVDPVTGLPRGRFDEGVAALQADVLSSEAVLALFDVESNDEEVQSVYRILADGLHPAFSRQGDEIYTAFP